MRKIICAILIFVLGAFNFTIAQASGTEFTLPSGTSSSDIESTIDNYVAKHTDTTAALSVAVFRGDNILFEKSYGYTDIENKLRNDQDAVFEWGSCTKLITWVSVMQLVEQGKLDLNADVRTYLPKNFFRKLKYDSPITMLNLMNHNAGWQEISTDLFLVKKKDVKDLGTALQYIEPEQVNEPGSIVAYSNWGAALAGYIVERISGISFSDYVHMNIFSPLGMEQTALSADLSDHEWVLNKRMQEKCYTSNNISLGTCHYYLSMYPAGGAVGTLKDFLKFAMSFTTTAGEISPLFQKSDTLKDMLSPSLFYGDASTARNCHGFWTDNFKVPVLWHNGGTVGSSSWLTFDPVSGTGMVIMTNQSDESTYNCGLLPFIFGNYDVTSNPEGSANIAGVYTNSRSCFKGYTKIYSLINTMQLTTKSDGSYSISGSNMILKSMNKNSYLMDMGGKQFFLYADTDKKGQPLLQSVASDYIHVNGYAVIAKFLLLLLFIISALYSLVVTLIKIIQLLLHKKLIITDLYRSLMNISVVAAFILFISIAVQLLFSGGPMYRDIQWRLVVCTLLASVPVIYTFYFIIKWKQLDCKRKTKILLVINGMMGLLMSINILYWIF